MEQQARILIATLCLLTACGGIEGNGSSGSSSSSSSSSTSTSSSSSSSSNSSSSSGMTSDEVATYFDQHPCGVNFTAMGSTDSRACYRTPEGKAECISYYHPDTRILPVTWTDGEPVTDVLHVSGGGGKGRGILVVTTDGAVYSGSGPEVDPIPVISSGGILVTGGYQNSCAMVYQDGKKSVWCDNAGYQPVGGLPEDFDAAQIVSGFFTSCALGSEGDVWCWQFADRARRQPFSAPIKFISFEEEAACGIKFDGTVECLGSWAPVETPQDTVRIHGGNYSLTAVHSDGQATYYRRDVSAPFDITDIVAATGTDNLVVVFSTGNGDLYLLMGDGITQKITDAKAQAAECPL